MGEPGLTGPHGYNGRPGLRGPKGEEGEAGSGTNIFDSSNYKFECSFAL